MASWQGGGKAVISGPLPFFDALYGDGAPGYLVIWTLQSTTWVAADDHGEAAGVVVGLAGTTDVYFGLGLHPEPRKDGRGKADGVIAIPGLWADIDFGQPGHRKQNLP